MLAILQTKTKPLLNNYGFYLLAILGSLISSSLALYYQQPFNVDGIKYLNTATAFLQDGIHAALSSYGWPFYSVLIALVHRLTTLSLENSAFLLNAILNTITILVFISLVKELGGNRRTQFFGVLIILIYPYLNHDRDNILRDFGYYAFAMLSLLYFIRFLRTLKWGVAIKWSISILIATLFRVEGSIFLLLAPLAVLLIPKLTIPTRCYSFLKINSVTIVVALSFFSLLILKKQINVGRLSDLLYYLHQGSTLIATNFQYKSEILRQTIFSDGLLDHLSTFLLAGLIGVLIHFFLKVLGVFALPLAYHALRYQLIPADKPAFWGWYAYLLINILIVVFFLLTNFFITERYIVFLCLLLLLSTPFSFAAIHADWQEKKPGFTGKKWFFPLLSVFLLVMLINSMGHFGISKTYVVQAGNWLQQNSAPNSRVFSNDSQLLYYSHRAGNPETSKIPSAQELVSYLQKINFQNYNYVALVIRGNLVPMEPQILAQFKSKPIKEFHNSHGDKALIFQLETTS